MGAGQPEVFKSVLPLARFLFVNTEIEECFAPLPVSLHRIINLDAFFSRGIIR